MLTDINFHTLFAVHVITCLALAASVGWGASRDNSDGLQTWALALCVKSCGFVLLALRGMVPDVVSILLGNVLISLYYSMVLLALTKYYAGRLNRYAFCLPPLAIAVTYTFLLQRIDLRIFFGNSILLVQTIMICLALLTRRSHFPSRGRDLILVAMLLAPPVLLIRIVVSAIDPSEVAQFFQASWVQILTWGAISVGTILVSNGFVLMAKERSDDRLRLVALKDPLTGCWNRIRIEEFAQQEMARLQRYGHPASLIMMDIDHFKAVNDLQGHAVGDHVLERVSAVMQRAIRTTDLLGRWGGEEFVVILPYSGFESAIRIAERIRKDLEAAFSPDGPSVTASFGVSTCLSTDNWHDWLARADRALYRAKSNGRNQVQVEGLEVSAQDLVTDDTTGLRVHWRTRYETGNTHIDQQHREMFKASDDLLTMSADSSNKDRVISAIRALLAKARAHFEYESALILKSAHEHAEQHIALHEHLVARSQFIVDMFAAKKITQAEILHFVIYELVVHHILLEDGTIEEVLALDRGQHDPLSADQSIGASARG